MPKIEVYRDTLFSYIGRSFTDEELEELLTCAKAELDDTDEAAGVLKIELNDTNRPDLWSTAGLGRQLRTYLGGEIPSYPFVADSLSEAATLETGSARIEVDPGMQTLRPYIVAFSFSGKPIDEPMLKDLIQTQEKLCWNYGRKRRSIAMGVYRNDLIEYPVRYRPGDPGKDSFIPLQSEEEMTLHQIATEHPKGKEFGHIITELPAYPYLTDAAGKVLSLPPVVNSNELGAVKVGDDNLFVELTGTDLPSLILTANIVSCDLADAGYDIHPVAAEYPYDTPFGRRLVGPVLFQEVVELDIGAVGRHLGVEMEQEEVTSSLARMGIHASPAAGGRLSVHPPEYRNDFLHPVDVMEDVMIGRGMDSFEPEMPSEVTLGRLSPIESFSRSVKDIMVGLGFQEMMYNYLGSREDYLDKMRLEDSGIIRIENPMSENYEYVRPSILPSLLNTEEVSANAVFPHKSFEIGKIAVKDDEEVSGTITRQHLGFLSSQREAGFNMINSQISALFFYLSIEYELTELDDPRFITGRAARILAGGTEVGVMGEIHPEVLENWGIQMPCAAAEVDLDLLMGK
ncbi:MAG: phenylalanine--tRNA ligase subunit beta [Spirochaetales bacterium]|nr:phenylalanine--tRNA ligase subunit beta [Spirochaetales bacterium]MCF7939368.1 phenylalanine--tRNA ligase subunit beta [Spirochaetales bacterium]